MKKEYDIIFIHRIFWMIFSLLVFCILLVGSIILLIFGNLIVGSICTGAISLIGLIYLITQPIFLKINKNTIKTLTAFGIVKKEKKLTDLQEIFIDFLKVGGRSVGDYFCLNFNSKNLKLNSFEDGQAQEDIIIFCYSKKGKEVIQKYSNLNVLDKR